MAVTAVVFHLQPMEAYAGITLKVKDYTRILARTIE